MLDVKALSKVRQKNNRIRKLGSDKMKLECIKELSFTDGYNVLNLEKGSIWEVDEVNDSKYIIKNENYWVEISEENYKSSFKKLN